MNNFHFYHRCAGLLAAAVLCFIGAFTHAQYQSMDWIVAVADNEVVLNSELQLRIDEVRTDFANKGQRTPPEKELHSGILERLIMERLQLQIAKRRGVVISDERVFAAMERIAGNRGMEVEEFQKQLQKDGLDLAKYRERIHSELVIEQVQRGVMRSRIQVGTRELEQYLKSNEAQRVTLGQYKILHIHLPYNPGADGAPKPSVLKKCIANLNKHLRKNGSQGLEELRGNKKCNTQYYELGWLAFADVPSIFEEVLPVLERGALSDPIVTENGSHLAWLHDRRGGSRQMITQYEVSHILITPSIVKPSKSVQKELADIRKRILSGESFQELALDFSEDPGSRLKGGELGWISPRETDEVFESVMHTTPIDEVSRPFETEFGWHILKVTDKRDYNAAPEMIRRQARNILYQKKYNEELENWLFKIRNEAHVQIRNEPQGS